MPMDLTDGKSTLVQVMAWCRQATSHYLSQCWPRSLLPYGIIRPQWVINKQQHFSIWHVAILTQCSHEKKTGNMNHTTKVRFFHLSKISSSHILNYVASIRFQLVHKHFCTRNVASETQAICRNINHVYVTSYYSPHSCVKWRRCEQIMSHWRSLIIWLVDQQYGNVLNQYEIWHISMQFVWDMFHSSPPGAAYMRQWIGSALLQIMACHLFGAKPLSKPMLGY